MTEAIQYRLICGEHTAALGPGHDFLVETISGADGLDISFEETQSAGQIGTTQQGASIGSRDVTVSGSILRDLDANERLLKKTVRPLADIRFIKIRDGESWYLEGKAGRTPDVENYQHYRKFQFKFRAFFPFWRTLERQDTLLGGLASAWFPTPVSTAGTFYISRYKQDLYTTVTNTGNAATDFTWTITASARVKNPMLWHNGTRTFLRLNRELLAGERAVISTADSARGCTLYDAGGASQDGFRYMDIDSDWWMTLSPGTNVLRLTADEGRENMTSTVTAPKGVASSV